MKQRALWAIASVGLGLATFMVSFLGCNQDYGDLNGKCQTTNAGPNDCTISKCKADGTPAPEPVPNAEKRVCFRGENEGVCVDGDCALICETQMVPCKCATDTACPDDKQCIDWACVAGACISTAIKEGELLDPLETGDCKKSVCQSGLPQTVADSADKPTEVPKDCQQPVCIGDMPGTAPDITDVPDATGCMGFKCAADGSIVPTNEPMNTACMMMSGMAGVCNANGVCKLENGQACTSQNAMDCLSGNCADGVCCNTACTDECKSCTIAGKVGVCTNIPFLDIDPSYTDPVFMMPNTVCDGNLRCNGMGKCLRTIGKGCTNNAECMSSMCAMPAKVCLGANGEGCSINASCASGVCNAMGVCS